MAAVDKPFEDLYAFLKGRWWGTPLIVIGVVAVIGFAVWNSLPSSTKERALGLTDSTPTVSSHSLPPPSESSGTASARVKLPAQQSALTASITAEATADASNGGWMELRVFVSGELTPCESSRVYKNPTSDSILTAVATCTVPILPGQAYEFLAEAPNENANARKVVMRATYSR